MLSTAFSKNRLLTAVSIVVASGALTGCAAYLQKRIAADKDLPVSEFIDRNFTGPSNAPARGTELVRFNEVNAGQLYVPRRYMDAYCAAQGGALVLVKQSQLNPIKPLQIRFSRLTPPEEQRRDRERLEAAYEKARTNGAVGQLECRDTGTNAVRWKVSIEPMNDFRQEDPNNALETNHLTLKIREVK